MTLSWAWSDWQQVGQSLGLCLLAAGLILVGYILGHH